LDPRQHVSGAIVTYHPNRVVLSKVIAAAAPQVDGLLIVANDGGECPCALPENAVLAKQDKNLGLGAAYNLAAAWARERGATHLLLLDQDSVPAPGMVAALIEAFRKPELVAAAGARWRDSRTGEDGFFVRLARWGARKYTPAAGEIAPVDFLISSGSLISLDAWADIGPFDEKLFIDKVDTDWALRARAKGQRLYGVTNARFDHAFGETTLTVSPLGLRRQFFLYSPRRNYYQLRNSIALWRRPYAPWPWILHDVRRTVMLTLYYVLFVPPRLDRLRAMSRAVLDGLGMK